MDWIIWLVFGLLLAALVGFLVFTFFRDKRKNKKIIAKRIELKRATVKTSKQLAIRIYTLILLKDEFLQEVVPGRSKVKMKNVNYTCRKFLKEIYDSKAFRTIYIESKDSDPNFAKNMNNLINENSNLWDKKCKNEIAYFENFFNQLKSEENFDTIKSEAEAEIRELFNQEVEKN